MLRLILFLMLLSQVSFAKKKGLFIFSAPRTTSTLLMRFFAQPIE